jgi:hypothetical protein
MQREEARMWKLEEVRRVSAKGEDPHGFNITVEGKPLVMFAYATQASLEPKKPQHRCGRLTVEGKPLVMFAYATQARAEEAAAQMRSAHEGAEVQPLGQ